MKAFVYSLIFGFMFILPGTAHAWTTSNWTTISEVWVDPYFISVRVASSEGQQSCATDYYSNGRVFAISKDANNYEAYSALLMSAYHAGKEVWIQSTGCAGDRSNIYALKVRDITQ